MKILLVLTLLLLLAMSAIADPAITTPQQMRSFVRQQTGLHSTVAVPDSTLLSICQQALIQTSIEIGGIEKRHRFVTVANRSFYPLPDTTVQILGGQMITSAGEVLPLKAWRPQFWDKGLPTDLSVSGSQQQMTPVAYSYWDDSLQLFPTPRNMNGADTVYLDITVEHPLIDSAGTIALRPAYTDAAILWACDRACVVAGLDGKAAGYMARYEKKKAELRAIYERRFDILKVN